MNRTKQPGFNILMQHAVDFCTGPASILTAWIKFHSDFRNQFGPSLGLLERLLRSADTSMNRPSNTQGSATDAVEAAKIRLSARVRTVAKLMEENDSGVHRMFAWKTARNCGDHNWRVISN